MTGIFIFLPVQKNSRIHKILIINMTLGEFKVIFYWEYAHRLLARFVGLFCIYSFDLFILLNSTPIIITQINIIGFFY